MRIYCPECSERLVIAGSEVSCEIECPNSHCEYEGPRLSVDIPNEYICEALVKAFLVLEGLNEESTNNL
jgi:hypothetical protein